jgi:hypothetical protein
MLQSEHDTASMAGVTGVNIYSILVAVVVLVICHAIRRRV